ncbi:unnamed protein product [Alopecurus aequalis]
MERYFSTDVLVDILQRVPPISRRRFRLVCRHWRDLVDNRTTGMQIKIRLKPLIWDTCSAVAYVVDAPFPWQSASMETCKRIMDSAYHFKGGVQLIGTCNGLLCLCSNTKPGGDIMVVNPATRQKLRVSPLRCAALPVGTRGRAEFDKAYSFGYHPITGQYKVVHVPCSFDRVCEFDTVHVLTLGEAAWREVQVDVPGDTKCNLNAGIVSTNGATYWVAGGSSPRILSFDLKDKRVTSITQLPPLPAGRDRYHLTEVRGRLGVATWDGSVTREVWVLEDKTWNRRYSFKGHDLPRPYFVYGDQVLTRQSLSFYWHRRYGCKVMHVDQRDNGRLVAKMIAENHCYRMFAYVETTEPLSVFRRKELIGDISAN